MRDKTPSAPDAASEDQALEHKVDAMMDKNLPDPVPEPPVGAAPTIDIFKGLSSKPVPTVDTPAADSIKTAPETSSATPKKITVSDMSRMAPAAAAASTVRPPTTTIDKAEDAPIKTEDIPADSKLDDDSTDAAVDEIAAHDSDEVLAAEDAAAKKSPAVTNKKSFKQKLVGILKNKWTWVGLAAVLVILAALPMTRYKLAGLIIKKDLVITVVDSKTATAVSGAAVSFNGHKGVTDASGQLDLKVPVGSSQLAVIKQYYKAYGQNLTVGFGSAAPIRVQLIATGRQVPITVINKISGQPITGATVKILNTTAKTNSKGQATIVLPTTNSTDTATVAASGYNLGSFKVQVTSSVVSSNTLAITPTGHIYFLSNLSGKIDVVETNLDGTNRKTVLAGTGQENPNDTSLLASRDWRYLVLKSQRSGSQAALYLIDTSNNKVTEFDSSNSTFTLVGWYGHNFMYDLLSNTVPQYQTGHETIKSYNADNAQLNQLDTNQAQGTSSSYGYQTFTNFYILNNELVYNTEWYGFDSGGSGYDLSSQADTIRAVQPSGQGKKDYQNFSAANTTYIQAILYEPQAVYYAVYDSSANKTAYYAFQNQSVTSVANLTPTQLNQTYPTYLLSPSGNQTFWTELRDGKNTLFTGDQNAQSPKQIAAASPYTPYGWYSDNYVLVSKDSDELYIMPATGSTTGSTPLAVSDYYKPAQDFNGYGYGYGGL